MNDAILASMHDLMIERAITGWYASSPNPLVRYGRKGYSQNDEDSITLEIIHRLGLTDGTYAEFGVGNGLENNTLILASLGWKGFWVGGETLAFDYKKSSRLFYIRDWITLDNINQLTLRGLQYLKVQSPDVVSLDLDGNDYHYVESLLEKSLTPSLFIVEYNAKFIPPARFVMNYNPSHQWDGSDYFGVALSDYVELFQKFDFRLVCCNAQTGTNAFFVHNKYSHLFNDVPENIIDIYIPPRYYQFNKIGHPVSPRTIENIME